MAPTGLTTSDITSEFNHANVGADRPGGRHFRSGSAGQRRRAGVTPMAGVTVETRT